ncbi:hypothetical protein VTO73DRAFT_4473 [Trametes versicolor]
MPVPAKAMSLQPEHALDHYYAQLPPNHEPSHLVITSAPFSEAIGYTTALGSQPVDMCGRSASFATGSPPYSNFPPSHHNVHTRDLSQQAALGFCDPYNTPLPPQHLRALRSIGEGAVALPGELHPIPGSHNTWSAPFNAYAAGTSHTCLWSSAINGKVFKAGGTAGEDLCSDFSHVAMQNTRYDQAVCTSQTILEYESGMNVLPDQQLCAPSLSGDTSAIWQPSTAQVMHHGVHNPERGLPQQSGPVFPTSSAHERAPVEDNQLWIIPQTEYQSRHRAKKPLEAPAIIDVLVSDALAPRQLLQPGISAVHLFPAFPDPRRMRKGKKFCVRFQFAGLPFNENPRQTSEYHKPEGYAQCVPLSRVELARVVAAQLCKYLSQLSEPLMFRGRAVDPMHLVITEVRRPSAGSVQPVFMVHARFRHYYCAAPDATIPAPM